MPRRVGKARSRSEPRAHHPRSAWARRSAPLPTPLPSLPSLGSGVELVEQRFGAAQAFLGQHHRLGFAGRISDHPLLVQAIERLPLEAFPGPVLVMQREPEKRQHRVVDLVVVDIHAGTILPQRHRAMLAGRWAKKRAHRGRQRSHLAFTRGHGAEWLLRLLSVDSGKEGSQLSVSTGPTSDRIAPCYRSQRPSRSRIFAQAPNLWLWQRIGFLSHRIRV